MPISTICPCTQQQHGPPHCKCVLHCCNKCPSLSITCLETNKYSKNMCSQKRFCVYINVSRCTMHGQLTQEEHTICSLCSTDASSVTPGKLYTCKYFVLLETSISEFH